MNLLAHKYYFSNFSLFILILWWSKIYVDLNAFVWYKDLVVIKQSFANIIYFLVFEAKQNSDLYFGILIIFILEIIIKSIVYIVLSFSILI